MYIIFGFKVLRVENIVGGMLHTLLDLTNGLDQAGLGSSSTQLCTSHNWLRPKWIAKPITLNRSLTSQVNPV